MTRASWVIGALLVLVAAGVLVGITFGPIKMEFSRLMSALFLHGDKSAQTLVWDLRMPRVAAALVAGCSLGVAGSLLQSSTRNPLGDPQLFGLGGGAAVIQALAIAGLLRAGPWGLLALSVLASIAGAGAVAFFASRRGLSPARLALIGVSLSALAAATATGIMAGARVFTQQSLSFVGGSLVNSSWTDVVPALPFLVLGILVAVPVVGNLNVMALGDPVAANLGAEPARTRVLAISAAGILGGVAVSVAGLVGFVGLLVPHVARALVGHDMRRVFLVSIPLGALVMLLADQSARLIFMPNEVPAGVVTAVIGAPLMIYVARRAL